MKRILLIAAGLFFVFAQAQEEINLELLEINYHGSGDPNGLSMFKDELYFVASDGVHGRELWKISNDTPVMVKDIAQGSENGFQHGEEHFHFTPTEDYLYFNTGTGEFWRTDGTESGTIRLLISPNPIKNVRQFGSYTYFTFNDGYRGNELWRTDGTLEGTNLFIDINEGPESGIWETEIEVFQGNIYFFANDGVHGHELWRSDGTVANTYMVKDINPGSSSSARGPKLLSLDDYLLFYGFNDSTGAELWRSDGTEQGTVMVKDIYPGYGNSDYPHGGLNGTVVDGYILFKATTTEYGGGQLWRSDGTAAGTSMVYDFYNYYYLKTPERGGSFTVLGDKVYLFVSGNTGDFLWVSDGTSAGTYEVTEINIYLNNGYGKLMADENYLYYMDRLRLKIFRTDGENTELYIDSPFGKNLDYHYPNGDKIYFTMNDQYHGKEVWEAGMGNQDLRPFDVNLAASSNPSKFSGYNDMIMFLAVNDNGKKVAVSDGTPENTRIVRTDFVFTIDNNSETEFNKGGDLMYFKCTYNNSNFSLCRSDGTFDGTLPLIDANVGLAPSMGTHEYGFYNDIYYFNAKTGDNPFGLYRTDGSPEGTYLLKSFPKPNVPNETGNIHIQSFLEWEGELYFSGEVKGPGQNNDLSGIWKTDGTEENTELVIELEDSGMHDWGPFDLIGSGEKLFFLKNDKNSSYFSNNVLYVTDGTPENVIKLYDYPYMGIDNLQLGRNLLPFGDKIAFVADNLPGNPEGNTIFLSDGTMEGTLPIDENLVLSQVNRITVCGDYIYVFERSGDINVGYLWRSDGTPEGTMQISEERVNRLTGSTCFNDNFIFFEGTSYGDPIVYVSSSDFPEILSVEVNYEGDVGDSNYEKLYNIYGHNNVLYFNKRTRRNGHELFSSQPEFLMDVKEFEEILLPKESMIALYPNPVTTDLNLKSLDGTKIKQILVFDMNGRLIEMSGRNSEDAKMDMSSYKPGIYLLKITTEKNTIGKRIIVK